MKFDLDKYVSLSAKLDIDGIDFDAFKSQPLDADTLRCLRYMHDVEFHTICYLRDLLVTRVHRDPEITTFLTFWSFEEYWHGEAIAKVLQAHGEVAGANRVSATRGLLGFSDRISPLISMVTSGLLKDFGAVHMAWGAINEWTTQAGYAQLGKRANHPVLSELLRRVMKQEGRHVDLYATQAKARLEGKRGAQRMTKWLLQHRWAPVGSGVMPLEEVQFMVSHLFGDEGGREVAARLDRRIDQLPGLSDLHLIEGALDEYGSTHVAQHPAATAAA